MPTLIRPERPPDYPSVYEINQVAFGQDEEALLVEALRKSDVYIPELSLVAEMWGLLVGHILFTKLKIVHPSGKVFDSLALAPMAVLPGFQNQGIGGQLIRHGLGRARELGHRSVIVLGHERYYPRFGFEPAAKWQISPPFEVPENAFMGIELVADGLKDVSGTVEYPKEFEGA